MAAAAILKITKIAISPQKFDRYLRNLVWRCKMGLFAVPAVNNLNFKNLRWQTTAILKTVKSPYLCNHLTDFDKIWQGATAILKITKSRYLYNGLTDLCEIW